MSFDGEFRRSDRAKGCFNCWRPVPENPAEYPDVRMWGHLPAFGFFVRHVEGLTLRDVQIRCDNLDRRVAAVFDDARDLELTGIRVDSAVAQPALWLNNVAGALLQNSRARHNPKAVLRITGAQTRGIRLSAVDLVPDLGTGLLPSVLLP